MGIERPEVRLFVPVSDAALGEIIGREFERYPISCQHSDSIPPKFAGQVRKHCAILIQLNAK